VGGSTSLAVLGAYVLAGEMERARGDYAAAFAAYEQVMSEPVIASRGLARTMAKSIRLYDSMQVPDYPIPVA
jgi:hypothetical protein